MSIDIAPRGKDGRFLQTLCDDPNCDGMLKLDIRYGRPVWQCGGLTRETRSGPLIACNRSYEAPLVLLQERS
jgi:hypothetical protein